MKYTRELKIAAGNLGLQNGNHNDSHDTDSYQELQIIKEAARLHFTD